MSNLGVMVSLRFYYRLHLQGAPLRLRGHTGVIPVTRGFPNPRNQQGTRPVNAAGKLVPLKGDSSSFYI